MKKILIVDDDEKIRKLYARQLTMEGFEILEVSNGADAYDILLERTIDLVLLDINMPEIDGVTMHEIMRHFCKRSKVIVFSVFSLKDQTRMIEGAHGYYDKTQGIGVLLTKIKEVLENEQVQENTYY